MDAVGADAEAATLLSGGFVFPGVEDEASFNEDGAAFGEVLAAVFGDFAPDGDVHEGDHLAGLPGGAATELLADGQAELGDGFAGGGLAHVGVPREVAHEEDFVEGGGHGRFPLSDLGLGGGFGGLLGGGFLAGFLFGGLLGELHLNDGIDGQDLEAEDLFDEGVTGAELVDFGGV